ncbi:type IV secretory pathway VirJ component [Amorphus suaedae]
MNRLRALAVVLLLSTLPFQTSQPSPAQPAPLASARIFQPKQAVEAVVALFSGGDGWQTSDEKIAESLADAGAIVIGVDTPQYSAAVDAASQQCAYLVSDLEAMSHTLQRSAGASDYHTPVVAGRGAGGAVALAIAAQSPADTIGHTVALDPDLAVGIATPLCTRAPRTDVNGRSVYGLTPGQLPDPIDVILAPGQDADGAAHIDALIASGFPIAVDRRDDSDAAFAARLHDLVARPAPADALDLPITPLPATAKVDALAVVYSGDGGWRDLDKTIAGIFQQEGLPTIGVDSLRYFWSRKSPGQVASDLTRLIDSYTSAWGVQHVLLVGYSFGADILPAAYNALDAAHRDKVSQITLLGVSSAASDEISVSGWLGSHPAGASPTLPEIARIDPAKIQCVYGTDEDDTACRRLAGSGAELIETKGGHHFDGDYPKLASLILEGLKRRL